jgi:hypothetical protein
MNTDEIKLTFVSVALYHPPLPRLRQNELPELFARLTRSYQLETFQITGHTEATFSTEGMHVVHVGRDRLHIDECPTVAFDLLKRHFSDIANTIKEALGIARFAVPRSRLSLLWPLPPEHDQNVLSIMRGKVINLKDDQYGLLGADSADHLSITIDVEMEEDLSRSIKIEPYESDPSQISIELRTIRRSTIETMTVIEALLDEDYAYLTERVTEFVETFMR